MSEDMPFFASDTGRYEVRIAGSTRPGPRTDSLALAMMIAGALLELGRAAEIRDRRDVRGAQELRPSADTHL
jgi:hypothetical protein